MFIDLPSGRSIFNVEKAETTTKRKYTVKGLEKGKTYYFKVRRYYKYPDGNIAYGPFSIIREVKL